MPFRVFKCNSKYIANDLLKIKYHIYLKAEVSP